ncbi:reverse transcriptase domain-containing protein [Flavobacterium sp. LS1P3]|uniref:reverse transcriptase domain-containing protein n=1 Tax=Flavobacterium sp. LS1P3 TaxID=3401720 RepID=UPI003AAE86EB
MKLINEISNKLFSIFYVDDKKFGRQQKDGSYKLVKETITVVTIDDMLLHQKSLLTYQELHVVNNARIKWICIDLDISKKDIDTNLVNPDNLKKVKEAANFVCEFLQVKNIPFLLEFSGRRGFHIWIIFDKLTSKEKGYKLIEYIHENVKNKFDPIIIADKFPKTPNVSPNTKGIGFGIKLPLSQNKGNGKLSFFLRKGDDFDYNEDNWLSKPNHDFLENQLAILNSLEMVSIDNIEPFLVEFDLSRGTESKSENFLKSKKADSSFLPQNSNLDSIIKSLSKCEHIGRILFEYEKGLGGKERSILVGLLIHLKTDEDEKFGYNILMELFSNIQGFDKEKTERNLENLNYFQPITCKNLENCSACMKCELFSPIELIAGVNLIDQPAYSIKNVDEKLFNKLKDSLYQYSLKNDEVALYPQLKKLENLDFINIQEIIHDIYKGINPIVFESYKFERNEISKTRELYNLDPINNIISTYFAFILNTIYYSEISNNSYGYQFSHSLFQNNLFNNWFANWARYTRRIESVLFNEEYEGYFLLKIDIKSFYDKIDTKRLKIKLFEEAPLKIREKLNEFSPEDSIKYKNIVNYLIDLSSKTNGNSETGLPQGPAYARYLAELYLNGLDYLIESFILENEGRGFYNRFVDDVFIFVESKERAEDLFIKIKDWLSVNSLSLNLKKTKLINVKEYASSGEYNKFKNDVKYDINRVNKNKNILSEEEIQQVLSKLDTLTDQAKFGLKDNLRFFYYQFKDDDRLDFIRKKLSEKLPYSNDGRGTLYMLFYADLIINSSEVFWGLVDDIEKIEGLSFTHYLNTILINYDSVTEYIESIKQLIHQTYLRGSLSNADKLLLTSLWMKTKTNINLNFPLEIMNSALEIPNTAFDIEQWELIEKKLQGIDNKYTFLKELDRLIKDNTYTISFLHELSSYSFIRFSEWSKSAESQFIDNHEILNLYYHCLCFLTLFEKSSDYDNVKYSWELLLEKSVIIGENSNKDYEFIWINKLEDFDFEDFSNGSYTFMLSNFLGASYSKSKCKNEFLEQYKNVLLMLLFTKDRDNNFKDFRKHISKFIDKTGSLFFSWVNKPNVSLYPNNDEVCLKNIALNGLIVLKNSDKVFVKSINKKLDFSKYDYLGITEKANLSQESEYLLKKDFLSDQLKGDFLVDVICNLSKVINNHKELMDRFKMNYPVFYNPSYSNGPSPLIPFYSDSVFESIININGNIEINSIKSYWDNLNEILNQLGEIALVKESNNYNFLITDLEERFFPKSSFLINTVNDKIEFISQFAKLVNNENIKTIFEYQYYWSCSVHEMAVKLKNGNKDLINYLKIHFDTFDTKYDYIDIFFSIDEKIRISDKTLYCFFQTIKDSITIFQAENANINIDLVNVVIDFIPDLIYENREGKYTFELEDFSLSTLDFSKSRDHSSGNKDIVYKYVVKLDGKDIDINNLYLFNNYTNQFEIVDVKEIEIKIKNHKTYCLINRHGSFLYILQDELIKAYDRINVRKNIYTDCHDSLTQGNVAFKKLFPISIKSEIASDIYDSFPEKIALEKKLALQYSDKSNIKERVVNWISLFNDESIAGSNLKKYMDEMKLNIDSLYSSILFMLNSHYSMDNGDLDFFKKKIIEYKDSSSHILFPIKNPYSDVNGLNRLINKCGFTEREIDYEKYKNILYTSDCGLKELVIVTDISISGSQLIKAFRYYNHPFTTDEEIISFNRTKSHPKSKSPSDERYFTFNDINESDQFKKNIANIQSVILLSPIITEEFKRAITALFAGKSVSFICLNDYLKEDSYSFEHISFDNTLYNLFLTLINDVELLKSIFEVEVGSYKEHLKPKYLNKRHLLFRLGSLPDHHLLLLSLMSKKGVRLLDYINNWEND